MGIWFFPSVVVAGNLAFKAYKLRTLSQESRMAARMQTLEFELNAIRERVVRLDEVVFFGDYDLRKQFEKLIKEMAPTDKHV